MAWRPILLRLGAVLLLLGGGYMGYRSYQEHERNAEIQGEIDTLKEEADKIRWENESLKERIEYFASPDFQEQEAKKKLGLRRQEESVMSIREDPSFSSLDTEIVTPREEMNLVGNFVPNYKKWWYRFFPPMNTN